MNSTALKSSAVRLNLVLIFYCVSANSNVIGSDAQNFNPITSGLDFVTVHSSETLKPRYINFGLFINQAINSLPYFDTPQQGRTNFQNSLLGMDINVGMGLGENWDFGLSLPFIVQQSVESDNSYRGEFAKNGNTEIRLNTKYRFLGDEQGGLAIVASTNINRIIDNPYSGQDSGPTYNLEVAGDTTYRQVALAVNAGYRWRSPGRPIANSPIRPLENQMIASMAASYLFSNIDTKLITEIFGSWPAQSVRDDLNRSLTTAEWLIGLKHDLTTQLALHAGGGTEILHGVSSPDWRLYGGLNYSFGPVFEKNQEAPALEPVEGPEERFRTRRIFFRFDSDEMVGDFEPILEEISQRLNDDYKELIIEGHTDSVGSEIYNKDLSMRRAQAIRQHLIQVYKVPTSKVSAIGYGESRPIADNGNYQGSQVNRRVEFKVNRK